MGKGKSGKTCAEAIRETIVLLGNRAYADVMFTQIKGMGNWNDQTIYQQLMACVINLPASYGRWPGKLKNRVLFLREDGSYELY
ncbi:MAG: hypothetical protein H8D89_01350 [Dehalococcoidia bacterium]|nr:hypothetical protein [Dehalococcoidia bacterium]